LAHPPTATSLPPNRTCKLDATYPTACSGAVDDPLYVGGDLLDGAILGCDVGDKVVNVVVRCSGYNDVVYREERRRRQPSEALVAVDQRVVLDYRGRSIGQEVSRLVLTCQSWQRSHW